MIKYSNKLLIALFCLVSSSTFASLITTELAEDSYISYGGYDWTWASSVNVTNYTKNDFFNPGTTIENTFEDASFHAGWMSFAEGSEIDTLFQQLKLSDFMRNGTAIHSFQYWNSYFSEVDTVFQPNHNDYNEFAFDSRSGKKDDSGNFDIFETFYVRASVAKVPEPTTLFIFAAGLVGFALRKRNIK
jgi:hypothetical protein